MNPLWVGGKKCVACVLLHRGPDVVTRHNPETQTLTLDTIDVTLQNLIDVLTFINENGGQERTTLTGSRSWSLHRRSSEQNILRALDATLDMRRDPVLGAFAFASALAVANLFPGFIQPSTVRMITRSECFVTDYVLRTNAHNHKLELFTFDISALHQDLLDQHVLVNYFRIVTKPDPVSREMVVYFNGMQIPGVAGKVIMLFGDLHFGETRNVNPS